MVDTITDGHPLARVLERATQKAREFQHKMIQPEHLLASLPIDGSVYTLMENAGLDVETIDRVCSEILKADAQKIFSEGIAGHVTRSIRTEHIIKRSENLAMDLGKKYPGIDIGAYMPRFLLCALLEDVDNGGIFNTIFVQPAANAKPPANEKPLMRDALHVLIEASAAEDPNHQPGAENRLLPFQAASTGWKPRFFGDKNAEDKRMKSPLERYSIDLTEIAAAGGLDPVIGRENEISRMQQILCRTKKNNPLLLGEGGVGKTAVVEGFARAIVEGNVPKRLEKKIIKSLDLAALVAGSSLRGEFEKRLKEIVAEVEEDPNIILFIDELHVVMSAGDAIGGTTAANILKPALARGKICCIGATTFDEYRKYIEKDVAMKRRFAPILVDEPNSPMMKAILKGIKPGQETAHHIHWTAEAWDAARELANRYLPNDSLNPDKTITFVDDVGAYVEMGRPRGKSQEEIFAESVEENEARANGTLDLYQAKQEALHKEKYDPRVTVEDVEFVLWRDTGIPVGNMNADNNKGGNLEARLNNRVLNQKTAVHEVAQAVESAHNGLNDPTKPIGSFLFLGGTGVGKTKLCKELARAEFGSPDNMIRIDMSEFMEKHSVSRLIGAPPGYVGYDEGGKLTEAVRRRPYSVILLDEIEKAHPDVLNLLLQVLDDGRLTDGLGRTVSFKNTYIVMTSNAWQKPKEEGPSFGLRSKNAKPLEQKDEAKQKKSMIEDLVRDHFRREFLMRIGHDHIINFNELTEDNMDVIARNSIVEMCKTRLAFKKVSIEPTAEALKWMIDNGSDRQNGARPLEKFIDNRLQEIFIQAIKAKQFTPGEEVVVTLSLTPDKSGLALAFHRASISPMQITPAPGNDNFPTPPDQASAPQPA